MRSDDRVRDAELVSRWSSGDDSAFSALYDAWFDRVYDLARRIVGDRDEAADVAHDAFVTAFRHRNQLRDPASFGGWLLRVARNRALDRVRRERRARPTEELDMTLGAGVEDRARYHESPERAAEDAELASLVWQSVTALGERDADVISLHVRQGLEPAEIAEVLGVTRVHAAQLLHRSRDRLGDAIRARVLWHGGHPRCEPLARTLGTHGAVRFDAATSRAINRHAKECQDCQDRQRTRLAPMALFAAIPVVAPPGIREDVWRRVASTTTGAPPAGDAGPSADGPSRGGTRRMPKRVALAGAAGAVAVAVAAIVAVAVPRDGDADPPVASTTTASAPSDDGTGDPEGADGASSAGERAPLVVAVVNDDLATTTDLLAAGADPDTTDEGTPVLYLASFNGFTAVVVALLDAGADPSSPTASGATPLHAAAERGHVEVVAALLEAGAPIDADDGGGRTPLFSAVFGDQPTTASALLAAGADPGRRSAGSTPLHVAATFGFDELVGALLDAGADPDALDGSGRTPADVARAQGHDATAALLDAAG